MSQKLRWFSMYCSFLSYQNHGDSISFCIICGFDGHLGKIEITAAWNPDSKRYLLVATKHSPFLLRHQRNLYQGPAQRPHCHRHLAATPAATPAPKLHSAHRTLTAPCSSIQVSKMQTAFCSGSKAAPTCQLQSAHATRTEAP